MTSVDIPELSLTELVLEPRGAPEDPVVPPPGRVFLGGPCWTTLTPDQGRDTDPVRTDGSRWVLGVLALSVRADPDAGDHYQRAWVEVSLTRPDNREPRPVVWSMAPARSAHEVTRRSTVDLAPSLTITDAGTEVAVERGTQPMIEDVNLQVLHEMSPAARWVLDRTSSAELRGCLRLALVVMAPAATAVTARVDVALVSAHHGTVFWWAETTHPRPARISVLP